MKFQAEQFNLEINNECINQSVDSINQSVADKLLVRAEVGRKKYGVTMDRTDFTTLDWLRYAQEEAMDFCVYLEKLIQIHEGQAKD